MLITLQKNPVRYASTPYRHRAWKSRLFWGQLIRNRLTCFGFHISTIRNVVGFWRHRLLPQYLQVKLCEIHSANNAYVWEICGICAIFYSRTYSHYMFLCSANSYKTENIILTLESLSFYFVSLHLTAVEPKRSIHVNLFCEDKYLCVSGPWKCTYTRPVDTDFLSWQFMLSSLHLQTFSDIDRSSEQCQNWKLRCKHASCEVSTVFRPSDRHDGTSCQNWTWSLVTMNQTPIILSPTLKESNSNLRDTFLCFTYRNTCPYTAICSSPNPILK